MIDICRCDVKDKEKLALFRMKRAEWIRWLSGESYHSIFNQIDNLLWFDTVFRTINEARRISSEKKSSETGFNRPLIDLLDRGFVESQTLAIRRLTDANFYSPQKAVISIIRLIDDIRININLFTRENYICHDGILYKELSEEKDEEKRFHCEHKHAIFDRLSGTSSEKRKRTDKLKVSEISDRKQELKVCDKIRTYVNKFVAHASDPENRPCLSEEQRGVTLDTLDKCYQAIVKVTSFIGTIVLYETSSGGVPTPQFDQLENLDKPMVSEYNVELLHSCWEQRRSEINSWENINWPK